MILKKSYVVLVLALILATGIESCMTSSKTITKKITVTVVDKNDNEPISNAEVNLKTYTHTDVRNDIKNTDLRGQCSFAVTLNELYKYEVIAKKDNYYPFFNLEGYNQLESSSTYITAGTGRQIVLFLTSDSLYLPKYYEKMTPQYPIDTLIKLLSTDTYQPENKNIIPKLTWDDIPKLLQIANSQTKITKFPRNSASSSFQEDCYLGLVSLWLIESIRITQRDELINPSEKFPSIDIQLSENHQQPRDPNNPTSLETAYQAYKNWWEAVKNTDKEKASKINPLENTTLAW